VGSSTEAVELARKVAGVVEEAGMIPAVWDTGTFPVGSTLLERIDGLAYEFDGAVLLFTPDTRSVRGGLTIAEPISNVMFEYGYLSARLTRQRVAICLVENARIPSDLQGVKVIDTGTIGYRPWRESDPPASPPELPDHAVRDLAQWLGGLPRLAERIPPVLQLHGYSGTWSIETRFEKYRGMRVAPPDEVYWYGATSLFIPPSGSNGRGVMHGTLHVTWGGYHSQHDVLNEVRDATVDRAGALVLRVQITRRHLVLERGSPPDERLRGDLPVKEWDIHLEPVAGKPQELRGVHKYTRGIDPFQSAVERYRRRD